MQIVSAALRAALTAELNGLAGPLGRLVFRKNIKIKDAKPRRALIRASLTSRSSGSPLHSVAPSARLHYADSAPLRRWLKDDVWMGWRNYSSSYTVLTSARSITGLNTTEKIQSWLSPTSRDKSGKSSSLLMAILKSKSSRVTEKFAERWSLKDFSESSLIELAANQSLQRIAEKSSSG